MLHYKAVAKTPTEKIGDILLGVFGMAAMIFTTAQTIKASCPSCALWNDSDCTLSSWLNLSLHQALEGAEHLRSGRMEDGYGMTKEGRRLAYLKISHHHVLL